MSAHHPQNTSPPRLTPDQAKEALELVALIFPARAKRDPGEGSRKALKKERCLLFDVLLEIADHASFEGSPMLEATDEDLRKFVIRWLPKEMRDRDPRRRQAEFTYNAPANYIPSKGFVTHARMHWGFILGSEPDLRREKVTLRDGTVVSVELDVYRPGSKCHFSLRFYDSSEKHVLLPQRAEHLSLTGLEGISLNPETPESAATSHSDDLGEDQAADDALGVEIETAAKSAARAFGSDLVFLLFLEPYASGVFGRSLLAPPSSDPDASRRWLYEPSPTEFGSVAASVRALDALILACGRESVTAERVRFEEFVKERTREDFAVVVHRGSTSDFIMGPESFPNCRYTALVARWWWRHGPNLDRALSHLRYVMRCRTPSGAWGAFHEGKDEAADTLTTSNVLRLLLDLESEGILQQTEWNRDAAIKQRGFGWLYETLSGNEDWWPLRPLRTDDGTADTTGRRRPEVMITADIVSQFPEPPEEVRNLRPIHDRAIENLANLWREHRYGLPRFQGWRDVDLEPTAKFAMACWRLRESRPELAREFTLPFFKLLATILNSGDSNVTGWATTLLLLCEVGHFSLSADEVFGLRAKADEMRSYCDKQPSPLKPLGSYEFEWVGREVLRHALLDSPTPWPGRGFRPKM